MPNKYFIGIELPKKLQKEIDLLRQLYYPYGYKMVPAHITLAGPFCLTQEDKYLNKKIEQIVINYNKFEISVGGFGTFKHLLAVYYLRVSYSGALINLHRDLCFMLQDYCSYTYPESYSYTPHITIANRLSTDQLRGIIQNTSHLKIDDNFEVDDICLFAKQEGAPYQVTARYTLDKYKHLRYHPEADLGNERSAAQANTLNPTSV